MVDLNQYLCLLEGSWIWVDGTEISWANFWSGDPNNHNGEQHCLAINKNHNYYGASSEFKWTDDRCFDFKKLICEKPNYPSGNRMQFYTICIYLYSIQIVFLIFLK